MDIFVKDDMTKPTTPTLIGCVQHDCEQCKATLAEIERLKERDKQSCDQYNQLLISDARLEEDRNDWKKRYEFSLTQRETLAADNARLRAQLIAASEREQQLENQVSALQSDSMGGV